MTRAAFRQADIDRNIRAERARRGSADRSKGAARDDPPESGKGKVDPLTGFAQDGPEDWED